MNFLITTFALLCLIALLAFGGQQAFIKDQIIDLAQKDHFAREFKLRDVEADHTFRELAKTYRNNPNKGKPHKSAEKKECENWVNLSRKPTHNRIDLGAINKEDFKQSKGESPDRNTWYHMAARLMRQLYGETAFFNEIPHVEYIILDQIFYAAHPKKYGEHLKQGFVGPISEPHHLASVPFQDERVRSIFCKMLEGGATYPSLFDYATFHRKKGFTVVISIHSVSPQVLTALLDNRENAEQLIAMRKERYERSYHKTKGGTVYAKEHLTKDDISQIASSSQYDPRKLTESHATF